MSLAPTSAVIARYLIQDHRFLDSFLTLLGAALASTDLPRVFIQKIAAVTRARSPRLETGC
jgi:hypothetical protein